MLATVVFVVALAALPAVLILALLAVIGSLVATLAEGRLSVVRPPQG